jgi:predicted GH43/DUF377 family glycosyl hydrolase
MTYTAFGPWGPRIAIAASVDLEHWERLGPISFGYQAGLRTDLGMYPNKDALLFPEPVLAPDGRLAYAMLHRPMWDLDEVRLGQGTKPPAGIPDTRQSIWISFVPLEAVKENLQALTFWGQHRYLAGPEFAFEELKIGGGPPPLKVPEGWLVIHHGVTGELARAFSQQQKVNYAAGALILDADEPWKVVTRTSTPLLAPATDDERSGIVPNVVFPTAIEEVEGVHYVFYGMADSKIGVARLTRRDS